jgi:hypothetical protein
MLEQKIANPETREDVIRLLAAVARTKPALALNVAQTLNLEAVEKYSFAKDVSKKWAKIDPAAAWDWALKDSRKLDAPGQPPLMGVVLDQLGAIDPKMLVSSVDSAVKDGNAPSDVYLPQLAAEALLKGGRFDEAREAIDRWVPKEPIAAPELDVKPKPGSPEEIGSWLRTLRPSTGQNAAMGIHADKWAKENPPAAMDWASSLAAGHGREEAMRGALQRWIEQDVSGAKQWIDKSIGEMRASDSSVDRFIAELLNDRSLLQEDPAKLLEWSKLMTDNTLRTRNIEGAILALGKQNPDAAARFLMQNPVVSPERKAQMLKLVRQGGDGE